MPCDKMADYYGHFRFKKKTKNLPSDVAGATVRDAAVFASCVWVAYAIFSASGTMFLASVCEYLLQSSKFDPIRVIEVR